MTRVFLDTNIPIYAAGLPHALKSPSKQVMTLAGTHPATFFTDSEVLQELLHRYISIHRTRDGQRLIRELAATMDDRIEPVFGRDVEDAANLATDYPRLDARDLVHAAVMYRVGATHIVTADTAFDALPDIVRLDPLDVERWRDEVLGAGPSR